MRLHDITGCLHAALSVRPSLALLRALLVAAACLGAGALLCVRIACSQPLPPYPEGPSVIVIEGDALGPQGAAMAGRMKACLRAVTEALDAVRLPYRLSKDSLVARDGLPDGAVAILPYNRAVSETELAQLRRFIQRGGRLIVCFVGRPDLCAELGAVAGPFCAHGDAYRVVHIPQGALPGAWGGLLTGATEAQAVRLTPSGRLLASFAPSGSGEVTPAVTLGPAGAFIAFAPTPGSALDLGRLLRALAGLLAPAVWEEALPTEPSELGPVGEFRSLADLLSALQRPQGRVPERAIERALQAAGSLAEVRRLLDCGQTEEALIMSEKAGLEAEEAWWMSFPSVPGEMRGCWATAMPEPSWDIAMANLAAANFNAVFPYIVSPGGAYYNSSLLPRSPDCPADADPLAEAVAAARAHGVELHARMLNLNGLFAAPGVVSAYKTQRRAMVSAEGETCNWICPSDEKNRRLQVQLATEIVTKYDVDGLQFDYMRYPGENYCFCERCRAHFEAQTGRSVTRWPADARGKGPLAAQYQEFRRERINTIVREITAAVREARPGLPISAAVFVRWDWHRVGIGQDWVRWLQEGWVDWVAPMNYTSDDATYREWVALQHDWIGDTLPWAAGVGPFGTGVSLDAAGVARQIRIARSYGAKGFVIFNYRPELAQHYLPYLALGISAEPTRHQLRARTSSARP